MFFEPYKGISASMNYNSTSRTTLSIPSAARINTDTPAIPTRVKRFFRLAFPYGKSNKTDDNTNNLETLDEALNW